MTLAKKIQNLPGNLLRSGLIPKPFPGLTPERLAILIAAIATLIAGLNRPADSLPWFGVMVMVTAFFLYALLDCLPITLPTASPTNSPTSSPQNQAAHAALDCRRPHAAFGFLFATGALIASGRPGFASLSFFILLFYFQIWRLTQLTAGQQKSMYLPDPQGFLLFIGRQLHAGVRGKLRLPPIGQQVRNLLLPFLCIVFLLVKKMCDNCS